ncbi:MAG TPA: DsbA family protein, partial [Chloroflexota bacterium]|nr:DsbA family protein [Chloroflexota bacterium]
AQQGEMTGHDYDLRIRRAFFAQGRNIGRYEVLLELAGEADLDLDRFTRDMQGDRARVAILAERQAGRERYGVRGTPTLMLASGTKLPAPLAEPRIRNRKIVAIGRLPCYGESCRDAVRALFERTLTLGFPQAPTDG